jgi:uncharacterized protein (TIGR03083 family)
MTRLAHDRYCAEIADQVRQLEAVLASGADLSATVPTCPDWTLEELVRHIVRGLRWTETVVRTRAQEEVPWDQVPGREGPAGTGDAAALREWLAQTGAAIEGTLREAGPDARVWAWTGEPTAGFWARRMTHELVVHGADAALAAGLPLPAVPAEVAADAVDELLEIVRFVQRAIPDGPGNDLRAPGRTIHLHATDTPAELNAEWLIEAAEDGVVWRRGHEKAAVALRGPVVSVLLAFYGRLPLDAPELQVLGDRGLLDFWREKAAFG